jgi:hypothetical protein
VQRLEGDAEAPLPGLHLHLGELRRDRPPGVVADRCEQAPDDLDLAEPDVAQVDPVELGGQRPSPQRPSCRRRLVASE